MNQIKWISFFRLTIIIRIKYEHNLNDKTVLSLKEFRQFLPDPPINLSTADLIEKVPPSNNRIVFHSCRDDYRLVKHALL